MSVFWLGLGILIYFIFVIIYAGFLYPEYEPWPGTFLLLSIVCSLTGPIMIPLILYLRQDTPERLEIGIFEWRLWRRKSRLRRGGIIPQDCLMNEERADYIVGSTEYRKWEDRDRTECYLKRVI